MKIAVYNPRIQKEFHVAFKVSDIETAIKGLEVLMPLYQPFFGYRCAIVVINGQFVELIETTLSENGIWGDDIYKEQRIAKLFDENFCVTQ